MDRVLPLQNVSLLLMLPWVTSVHMEAQFHEWKLASGSTKEVSDWLLLCLESYLNY